MRGKLGGRLSCAVVIVGRGLGWRGNFETSGRAFQPRFGGCRDFGYGRLGFIGFGATADSAAFDSIGNFSREGAGSHRMLGGGTLGSLMGFVDAVGQLALVERGNPPQTESLCDFQ